MDIGDIFIFSVIGLFSWLIIDLKIGVLLGILINDDVGMYYVVVVVVDFLNVLDR